MSNPVQDAHPALYAAAEAAEAAWHAEETAKGKNHPDTKAASEVANKALGELLDACGCGHLLKAR